MERQVNIFDNDEVAQAFSDAVARGRDPLDLLTDMAEILTLTAAAASVPDDTLIKMLDEAAESLTKARLFSIAAIINEAAGRLEQR